MKIIISFTIIILTALLSYGFGYKAGGEDFVYLDHIIIGNLASAYIQRCDKKEDSLSCYKWHQQMDVYHAQVFYTQHYENLSPISKYVFSDMFGSYIKSTERLYQYTSKNSDSENCKFLQNAGDDAVKECYGYMLQFLKASEKSFNKSSNSDAVNSAGS